MSIRKEIVLRYRDAGHARFDIPAFLREQGRFERLLAELRRIEGVYRVDGWRERGKLSIRYQDWELEFPKLLREFDAIVTRLEQIDAVAPHRARASLGRSTAKVKAWFDGLKRASAVRRAREKYQEARETATAIGIIANRMRQPPDLASLGEKWVVPLLNDLLAFYIVRTHWRALTQLWLRRPLEHKYHWLAAVYLIFLFARSRTPKQLPPRP